MKRLNYTKRLQSKMCSVYRFFCSNWKLDCSREEAAQIAGMEFYDFIDGLYGLIDADMVKEVSTTVDHMLDDDYHCGNEYYKWRIQQDIELDGISAVISKWIYGEKTRNKEPEADMYDTELQ